MGPTVIATSEQDHELESTLTVLWQCEGFLACDVHQGCMCPSKSDKLWVVLVAACNTLWRWIVRWVWPRTKCTVGGWFLQANWFFFFKWVVSEFTGHVWLFWQNDDTSNWWGHVLSVDTPKWLFEWGRWWSTLIFLFGTFIFRQPDNYLWFWKPMIVGALVSTRVVIDCQSLLAYCQVDPRFPDPFVSHMVGWLVVYVYICIPSGNLT
jgi:hypothetical protein